MSSIFEEKIEFDGKKYRTPKFKEGFEFIYHKVNQLQQHQKEKGDAFTDISSNVLEAGLEPARTLLFIGF